MKNNIKQFFDFNKKERIGVLALLSLLIALGAIYLMLPDLVKPTSRHDQTAFKKQVEAFINARKKEKEKEKKHAAKTKSDSTGKTTELTPFPFDPNNLPREKWRKIGFSKGQIDIIKNYEKSGGHFYDKDDLKKIYGITEQEFEQLASYIRIEKQEKQSEKQYSDKKKSKKEENDDAYQPPHLDINSADSTELIKIRGIGPVFSKRIVKYRNYLGGYYAKKQLLEVYSFDSADYAKVQEYLWVDTSRIKSIALNKASFSQLQKHPYIDYYLVKEIVNYREDNGRFENLKELKQLDLMYDELFQKIKHYLTL